MQSLSFLQGDELADRAEIVAEMEISGRLHAGEDERLECAHGDILQAGGRPGSVGEAIPGNGEAAFRPELHKKIRAAYARQSDRDQDRPCAAGETAHQRLLINDTFRAFSPRGDQGHRF
jgi:hypothetical protein